MEITYAAVVGFAPPHKERAEALVRAHGGSSCEALFVACADGEPREVAAYLIRYCGADVNCRENGWSDGSTPAARSHAQ